jgi:hypothetical protein
MDWEDSEVNMKVPCFMEFIVMIDIKPIKEQMCNMSVRGKGKKNSKSEDGIDLRRDRGRLL